MAWPDGGSNESVSSIGSGKTHADIATWDAATDNDNVTNTVSPTGEVYDTADYNEAVYLNNTGGYSDSTYYRTLRVATGEGHAGKIGTGATINNASNVQLREDYCVFEGFILDGGAAAKSYYALANARIMFRDLVIDNAAGGSAMGVDTPGSGSISYFRNCIAHGMTTTYAAALRSTSVGIAQNCSIHFTGSYGALYGTYTNCIIIGASTQDYYTGGSIGGDYNIGGDTSAPGANSIDNETTAIWTSVTGGSEDLHLASGATAADAAGTDLSGSFTIDIDGDTRVDWDIGADEVVSGGTTLTPSAVGAAMTIPAPTLQMTLTPSSAPISHSAVAAAMTIPAPTLQMTLTPSAGQIAASIPAPTLKRTITPSALAAAVTIPAPTVQVDIALTPSPVAMALTIPAPTVLAGIVLTPSPLAMALEILPPVILGLSGYDVFLAASPGAIDYTAPIATAPAGATSIVLTGEDLSDDVDYWLAVRARTAANVRSTNNDPILVRISGGALVSASPNRVMTARAVPTASAGVDVAFTYDATDEGDTATTVEIAEQLTAQPETYDWDNAESFTIAGNTTRTVSLTGPFVDTETVRLAIRAKTDAGATGPPLELNPVVADSTAPPAVNVLLAAQET